jgi:hypothetical protein
MAMGGHATEPPVEPLVEPPAGPSGHPSWWRGYFSQRAILTGELPKIMRRHIVTGAMGSTYGYLITGLLFVYYGGLIGLKPFHWGLMSGLSQWVVAAGQKA